MSKVYAAIDECRASDAILRPIIKDLYSVELLEHASPRTNENDKINYSVDINKTPSLTPS